MKSIKLSLVLLLAVSFTLSSCSKEPEPLNFGTDQCEHCLMKIVDNKFGAEIVTNKGKVYKFDAAECMFRYVKQGKINDADVNEYLVVDAAKTIQLVDAKQAFYLISEKFPSPMGANLSSFKDKTDAESYHKQYEGELKDWNGMLEKFKITNNK